MKRINKDKLSTIDSVGNQDNISSFACRADVIYKKILREFRRYFINDFTLQSGFKDFKKCKKRKLLAEKLLKYVQSWMDIKDEDQEDVAFYLGTLISPQQIGTSFFNTKKSKKEIFRIHETLYKFSIAKIDKLLENKFIGYLLKKFISNSKLISNIIESWKISEDSYKTAFKMIESRSLKAINNY